MLIEYAISAGEGALIGHGTFELAESSQSNLVRALRCSKEVTFHEDGVDMRLAIASPDCTTGE